MYERYKKLLDEKGLKNSDVSRGTGVSNMTLSDWKNGKSKPKTENIVKIANFLDTTVEYLTVGKDNKEEARIVEEEVSGEPAVEENDLQRVTEVMAVETQEESKKENE